MRYVPGYEEWKPDSEYGSQTPDYQPPSAETAGQKPLNHAGMLMLMLSSFQNPDHAKLLGQHLGRLGKEQ